MGNVSVKAAVAKLNARAGPQQALACSCSAGRLRLARRPARSLGRWRRGDAGASSSPQLASASVTERAAESRAANPQTGCSRSARLERVHQDPIGAAQLGACYAFLTRQGDSHADAQACSASWSRRSWLPWLAASDACVPHSTHATQRPRHAPGLVGGAERPVRCRRALLYPSLAPRP
jgi:hypothetical protein